MKKTTNTQSSSGTPEEKALAVIQPEHLVATDMLEQLRQVQLSSQEELEEAGELLTEVKRRAKVLESARKEITTPMLAAKKKVDDLFRPPLKLLEECEAVLKAKVQVYMREQEAAVLASIGELQAHSETLAPVELPALPSNMSERRVWTIEVEHPELVPREFLMVDEAKIMALIKAVGGENVVIPGVKVFQERQLAVRTGGGDA